MNNLIRLAALRTFVTGTEHVVCERRHGISILSAKLAKATGARVLAALVACAAASHAATLPPPPAVPVVRPAPVQAPENATTCYLNGDSCWSK